MEETCYELKHCDEAPSTLFYLQDSVLTFTPKYKTEIDTSFCDNIQLNTSLQTFFFSFS